MGKTASKLKKRKNNVAWSRLGSFVSLKNHQLSRSQTQHELPNPDKILTKPQSTPSTPILSRALPEIPSTPTSPDEPASPRRTGPHLPIKQWLGALELWNEYSAVFSEYKGVEEIIGFDEAKIKEMGVKNSAHRARIITSLTALKKKYNKTTLRRRAGGLRHSMAVDTRKQQMQDIDKLTRQARKVRAPDIWTVRLTLMVVNWLV